MTEAPLSQCPGSIPDHFDFREAFKAAVLFTAWAAGIFMVVEVGLGGWLIK